MGHVITLSLAVEHPPHACHNHAHTHMRDRIAMSLPLAQPTRYNTQTTGMTENYQYNKGWRLDGGLCARSMGTVRHQ